MSIRRIFLDTNILLDIIINENSLKEYDKVRSRVEEIKKTKAFIRGFTNDNTTFVLNTSTITTIFYILNSRQKLTSAKVAQKLLAIENEKNLFYIVQESKEIRREALAYAKENNADYEDALQYFCALKSGCELIFTNDKNFPKLDISLKRTNGTEDYLIDMV